MGDPQWPVLVDAGYRVVRCGFRGYGDSPAANRPYGDAGDVSALLERLGVERAALVGASCGGEAALEVAARPEAVTALVLFRPRVPGRVPGAALRAFDEREEAMLEAGDLTGRPS